ncbi:hypothetical protein T484DRAFT_1742763 [Baffinella frigidus]|nr:hypothetical protein T484DRAFT_1742763 [Cryptophyta sp. CCMP2293]
MSQRPARLLGVGLISLALAAPTGSAFSPPAAVGTAHGHASLFAGSSAARSLSCMGRRNVCAVIEKKMGSGEATHPALKSSATEFFERPEKTWRPMAALLFSQALAVNGCAETRHPKPEN